MARAEHRPESEIHRCELDAGQAKSELVLESLGRKFGTHRAQLVLQSLQREYDRERAQLTLQSRGHSASAPERTMRPRNM